MPLHLSDRSQASAVIDLTLSDDDDDDDDDDDRATTSHAPILQTRPNFTVSPIYTVAQEPSIPSHHGLPSSGFHSRGPWQYAAPVSAAAPMPQAPASHPYGFTNNQIRAGNPAKRMRLGERPVNLVPTNHSLGHSALPEAPLDILGRPSQRTQVSAQQVNVSAHTALNIFNAGMFPGLRKHSQRKTVPVSTGKRQHVPVTPRISKRNLRQGHTAEASLREVAPIRSSSSRSSDVEILEWRKNESPQRAIIKNAQKTQIFPHVRDLLRELGEGLPEDEVLRVGKEVVDKICDRDVANMILSNHGSLPHHHEMQLADRARKLIKRLLENVRSRMNNAAKVDSRPESRRNQASSNLARHEAHPDLQSPSAMPNSTSRKLPQTGSSSGSEVDAVFDRSSETVRPTPITSPDLSVEPENPWPAHSQTTTSITLNNYTRSQPGSQLVHRASGYSRTENAEPNSDSELSSDESLDEDITADVRAYLAQLKPPSAPNSPVKASLGEHSNPADLRKRARKKKGLEREERHYRLFGLDPSISRPYLSARDRSDLERGLVSKVFLTDNEKQLLCDTVIHVDFAPEEMAYMADVIAKVLGIRRKQETLRDEITRMMKGQRNYISKIVGAIGFSENRRTLPLALRLIKRRGKAAVTSFLQDATNGTISATPKVTECHTRRPRAALRPSEASINSLLLQREIFGRSRTSGSQREFKTELASFVEDTIVPHRQWMDCSGDVTALAWNSEGTSFVCGATAHSDLHNQQYNKPGNLTFGSTHSKSMQARHDHRIPRPIVTKGGKSLEAMREIQDRWLYSSVVSAAHSSENDMFFTSSFDKTVKVWGKGLDDTQSDLFGTWAHRGNVNFVVTSENHGLVATACDIVRDAIRVYDIDNTDVSSSRYVTYSGLKANEQVDGDDKTWAYFPATIAWAKCPLVAHLLLVGYSPRSTGANESDIPEDRCNLGELCLWDVSTKKRIDVWPRSQNVFEVVWHPTQPVFFAATAPSGKFEPWVRTQIRVYALNKNGAFSQTSALDCCALDINEITVMPTSRISCFVTASCTDGNVYVWDTALGDRPVHVLAHGASIDDRHSIDLPNELSDSGVRFAAWGASAGRFYTGSSDGVVKAWDVRRPRGQAFIRDVVRLSGGVSSGAFSPEMTHMLIGDATGKVHLLNIKETEPAEEPPKVCPKLVTPHPQPDEGSKWAGKGGEISSDLIRTGIIVIDKNKEVGAVQGPAYDAKKWYCAAAHQDGDPMKPLLPEFADKQQWKRTWAREGSQQKQLSLPRLPKAREFIMAKFAKGRKLELDLLHLDTETLTALQRERWIYEDEYGFLEEEESLELGGRPVKKLRKGEDWEDDWVDLDEQDWVDLESAKLV